MNKKTKINTTVERLENLHSRWFKIEKQFNLIQNDFLTDDRGGLWQSKYILISPELNEKLNLVEVYTCETDPQVILRLEDGTRIKSPRIDDFALCLLYSNCKNLSNHQLVSILNFLS